MMLALVILSALAIVPILAIIALVRSGRAERRVKALEDRLASMRNAQSAPPAPAETSAPAETLAPAERLPSPPSVSMPMASTSVSPMLPLVASEPKPIKPGTAPAKRAGAGIETQLGTRVAAWVGVAMLLIGAGFFVTYAIQRQWVSPGLRVTLGILFGAALTAVAHNLEGRGYRVLARVLTAGGGASMYFSIYAARGLYGIIGPVPAFLGLAFVSACCMALSALYNSQSIALGALLGAFFVPPFIGSETENGVFFLGYIAVLNIPAIGLGLKRRWQLLYTVAAALTWIAYFWAVGDEMSGLGDCDWQARLVFALLFFGQFTALSMMKLWKEVEIRRPLDFVRQSINSILLLAGIYIILKGAELNSWMGAAMLAGAGGHLLLAAVARKRLPSFANDAMIYLLGAATFAVFAVPLQFDGAWVSAAWAVEGLLLAWFAARIDSPLLKIIALAITALGWFKALLFDATLYTVKPALFLNGRFAAGLLAAGSFLIQSRIAQNGAVDRAADGAEDRTGAWPEIIVAVAMFASAFVLVAECWFILGFDSAMGAAMGTFGMTAAAMFAFWKSEEIPEWRLLHAAAWIMALLAVIKILTIDRWGLSRVAVDDMAILFNMPVLFFLLSCGVITLLKGGARGGESAVMHIIAPLAAIITVTTEIGRAAWPWKEAAITIFWTCSAMALVWCGLRLRRRYFRWFGLILFAVAAAKALLVDLSGLRGLPRIISFMVAGALFLALSFVYQNLLRYVGEPEKEKLEGEDTG